MIFYTKGEMTLFTFLSLVFQNLSEALTRVSVSLAQSENLYSKVGEGCKINKTLPMLVQKKTFTSARRWFSAYRKFQNFFYKKKKQITLHSTPVIPKECAIHPQRDTIRQNFLQHACHSARRPGKDSSTSFLLASTTPAV